MYIEYNSYINFDHRPYREQLIANLKYEDKYFVSHFNIGNVTHSAKLKCQIEDKDKLIELLNQSEKYIPFKNNCDILYSAKPFEKTRRKYFK